MNNNENPLGYAPISGLILKFALPSILSLLVTSAYNITDQIFIGNVVGMLGNAATNVAFPVVTLTGALAQLAGIGTAANFNLGMGAKKEEEAKSYIGTGLLLSGILGVLIVAFTLIFSKQILIICGATEAVMPFASSYLNITAWGLFFLLFTTAVSNIIRSDGSPTYSMLCNIIGALLNVFLDYLLMFVFNMGIEGAAIATVIGQAVSFVLSFVYFFRFKAFKITLSMLNLKLKQVIGILSLGVANFINLAMIMLLNIVLNNVLKYYGKDSIYGADIPLAVSGVVSKISSILIAISVGLAQGCQPILGFNMGAKNYKRVRETFIKAVIVSFSISIFFFIAFQFYPDNIILIFGSGDNLYIEFARKYLRIFLFFIFGFAIQPLAVNYFTATGNVFSGIVLSTARQGLVLIPFLIIFPMFWGLDGILYAGPASDIITTSLAVIMVIANFAKLRKKTE